jgi:hypothetical protein
MKGAFYAGEAVLFLLVAGGLALSAGQAAEWLTSNLLHPVVVMFPAGLLAGLCRDRHPLLTVERWHGVAVRRLDDRG